MKGIEAFVKNAKGSLMSGSHGLFIKYAEVYVPPQLSESVNRAAVQAL